MAVVEVLRFGLLSLYATAVLGLTCDDADCGLGFCIEQQGGDYQCICLNGYEGERCERLVSAERLVRNTKPCDGMPCQNGGTCSSLIDEMDGEADIEMGEAIGETAIDEESPDSIGESMIDCDSRETCFVCVCPPNFTGPLCADEIDMMPKCTVRNCSRCDANPDICEACTTGLDLSNNECKCPVAGCSVCDTSTTACDVCSADGAAFDSVSLQCVVSDSKTSSTDDTDYYLSEIIKNPLLTIQDQISQEHCFLIPRAVMLLIIMVIVPVIALVCCTCSILVIAARCQTKKSAVKLASDGTSAELYQYPQEAFVKHNQFSGDDIKEEKIP